MKIGSPQWKALIKEGAEALDIVIQDEQLDLLAVHAKEMLTWNQKINITAITDPVEMAAKHYVDSLAPAHAVSQEASLLDIGSGGGFPGIPLKILYPMLTVKLVDASRKRINFLKHAIRTLKLSMIEACHCRVQDLAGNSDAAAGFDVVISRAFSRLDNFVILALPYVKPGGKIVAMKGRGADQELASMADFRTRLKDGSVVERRNLIIDVNKYRLPFNQSERSLFVIKRQGPDGGQCD